MAEDGNSIIQPADSCSPFWDHVLVSTPYQLIRWCTYLQEQEEDRRFSDALSILINLPPAAKKQGLNGGDYEEEEDGVDRFEQDVNHLFAFPDYGEEEEGDIMSALDDEDGEKRSLIGLPRDDDEDDSVKWEGRISDSGIRDEVCMSYDLYEEVVQDHPME